MLNYRSNKLKDVQAIYVVGRNENGEIYWASCFFSNVAYIRNNKPFKSKDKEKTKEILTHIYNL